MISSLRNLTRALSRFQGVRSFASGTYEHEASHQLQASVSSVSPEEPLYNEQTVRKWLGAFEGGKVTLDRRESERTAHIILDNPKAKNALTGSMMIELSEAVEGMGEWEGCEWGVVRGKGGEFCSGGDLKFMREIAEPAAGSKMSIFMQAITSKLYTLPVITVALIQGHALGGGAELSVACDFRLMESNAKIGFVQAHLGVSPGWGGGTHLTRLVRPHTALSLLSQGTVLNAQEALNLGLVDEVIEPGANVDEALKTWMSKWDRSWTEAVKSAKRVVRNCEGMSYADSLDRERDIFTKLWGGRSHRAALKKIFDKSSTSKSKARDDENSSGF